MLKTFYTRFLMIVAALCLFGGGKSYAAVGDEVVLKENYQGDGNGFSIDVPINWSKQKFHVEMDISTCQTFNEDIFALGVAPGIFKGSIHFYWKSATSFSAYYEHDKTSCGEGTTGTANCGTGTMSFSSSTVTVEVSKNEGLVINGTSVAKMSGDELYHLKGLFALSNVKFGSGDTQNSKAKYTKISLIEIPEIIEEPDPVVITKTTEKLLKENYDNGNTRFSFNTDIDFSNQTFEVVMDLSNCTQTNENVLSFGADLQDQNGWGGVNVIHFFYTKSSKTLEIAGFTPSSRPIDVKPTNISGEVTVRISSDGLYVNGTQYGSASKCSGILALTNLLYGSTQGSTRSNAVWKSVKVITNTSTTVDRLFGDDDSSFTKFAKTGAKVALTRTLGAGYWNTLCLPFSLTADQVKTVFGDGVQLRTYSNVTGSTMNFVSATNIEAGAPYLVKVEEDVVDPIIDGVDVTADEPVAKGDAYAMKGTYTTYALATNGSNLFLGDGDKFYRPAEGQNTMKGLRAYFIVPSGTNAAALYANIDGVETAIDEVCADAVVDNHATVYNLNGQVVGNSLRSLPRGIYIQNGKKIVIK